MKKLLLAIVASISLMGIRAEGRDSTCLLGDDGKIAVTTLEHRAEDGRATEVTLIYGAHLLRGALKDTDSGKITLAEFATKQMKSSDENYKDNYIFTGTINVNYENSTITLRGKIQFTADGDAQDVKTTLKCKELEPD